MTELLTRSDALADVCEQAAGIEALALDTEFMRERTYYPELCLIQAALPEQIVLIDPLADIDLSPLRAVISGSADKILHASRQDQEVLVAALGCAATPLFDTQHAAALCGHPPQWSYAALVKAFCDVELPKDSTRTDWSRRPLSDKQLAYAADDVRYLIPLRDMLQQRLRGLGREAWFLEDMRQQEAVALDVAPQDAWLKVKGKGHLQGPALAVLQALAAWRERRAQSRNRPRRWILADDALLALAQAQPSTKSALAAVDGVSENLVKRQGQALLETIEVGLSGDIPELDQRIPDKALLKRLQVELKRIAEGLSLETTLLATRADLNALVLDGASPRLDQGWRAEVVGAPLRAALAA